MIFTRAFFESQFLGFSGSVNLAGLSIAPQSLGAGAVNGLAVDGTTWGGQASATVAVGAITGTLPTLDVTIQQSLTGSSGWATIYTFAQITTANQVRKDSFVFSQPFLRAVSTVGGTVTPTFLGSVTIAPGPAITWESGGVKVGSFISALNNGLDTTMADLVLPTGAGATPQNWTGPSAAYYGTNGAISRNGGVITFAQLVSQASYVAAGWYIQSTETVPRLLAFEYLSPAPVVAYPDKVFSIIPRISLPLVGDYGGAAMWNG